MKTRIHALLLLPVLIIGLLISSIQCTTLDYAGIQSDFEQAVMAENTSVDQYRKVGATLTDTYILRLDAKLRPNAWMLRALSEWRLGEWESARRSAAKGLKANPPEGSRDLVMLSMIDSMTIMTDLERRAIATGEAGIPPADYPNNYESALKAGWTSLANVERHFGAAIPDAAKDYWNYQRWRFAVAWRGIISRIAGEAAARNEASERATTHVGKSLKDAGEGAKSNVSSGSSFKSRMK
jgi:hypothetical protein